MKSLTNWDQCIFYCTVQFTRDKFKNKKSKTKIVKIYFIQRHTLKMTFETLNLTMIVFIFVTRLGSGTIPMEQFI